MNASSRGDALARTAQRRPGLVSSLDRADAAWRRVSRLFLLAGGWGVMAFGLLVALDVACRNILGRNLGGVDEIAGYLFAIGISWSLAEAFYARSHVRIDVLYQHVPLRLRALLDFSALLGLAFLAAFLIFSGWLVVTGSLANSARSATSLQIPLIIPQAFWFAGFVVFLVALALAGMKALAGLLQGRAGEVNAEIGVMSAVEEATEALDQTRTDR